MTCTVQGTCASLVIGYASFVQRKSHDATQKKCLHLVHFNVPRDWFEKTRGIKNHYSEGGKKFVGVAVYWEE